MSEFTKGPWISGWGEGLTGITCPAIGGSVVGEQISHTAWVNRDYEDPKPRVMTWPVRVGMDTVALAVADTEKEAVTRSHLISAAPDLYEALKFARAYIGEEEHITDRLDAAISKAEGK